MDDLISKPRRRVEFIAKISADSWRDLQHHLTHLATEIARHERLSKCSISGGYSTGHIIVTSEDEAITHDVWAMELDAHLEAIRAAETQSVTSQPRGREGQ